VRVSASSGITALPAFVNVFRRQRKFL